MRREFFLNRFQNYDNGIGRIIYIFLVIFALSGCGDSDNSNAAISNYTVIYSDNVEDETIDVPTDSNNYATGAVVAISSIAPERSGYTFAGWNTATNGTGIAYAAGGTLGVGATDVILYAQWTIEPTYTVTYDDNADNETIDVPADNNGYVVGTVVSISSIAPERSGHTFAGWNTATDGTGTSYPAGGTLYMNAADVILYAQWTIIPTYTITYDDNVDGQTIDVPTDSNSYVAGATASLSNITPVRTGYTFAGWNTAPDGTGTGYNAGSTLNMNTDDVTLYAQWTIIPTYMITYDDNVDGEIIDVPTDSNNYVAGAVVSISSVVPALSGYTFAGWNTATDGTGTGYLPGDTLNMNAADVTLYAQGDVTLYAQWQAILYTITYDDNVDDETIVVPTDNGSYVIGTAVSLSNSMPTRTDYYTFAGWNTAADGTGTTYAAGASLTIGTADVILYAQWQPVLFTITYDANAGFDSSSTVSGLPPTDNNTYQVGDTVTVLGNSGGLQRTPNSASSSDEWYFVGWRIETDNGTVFRESQTFEFSAANTDIFPGGVLGDVTFYARWHNKNNSDRIVRIAYDGNGAQSGSAPAQELYYVNGDSVTILDNIGAYTQNGSIFNGWSTDQNPELGDRYNPGDTFAASSNKTLYAVWGKTVSYDANLPANETLTSGTVPVDNTVYLSGETATVLGTAGGLTVSNNSGANFVFDGWRTTDGTVYFEGDQLTLLNTSVTLYARWLIPGQTIPVSYDANGSIGEPPATAHYLEGDKVTVEGTASLYRTGYIFGGWTPIADDNSTLYTVGDSFVIDSPQVNLYAYWQPRHTATGTHQDEEAAVAMSGDYAIIGLRYRNKILNDVNGEFAGAAFVYAYSDDSWVKTPPELLIARDVTGEEDVTQNFGQSVAIHVGTRTSAIVGANNAAYIFEYNGSNWSQVAKFTGDSSSTNIGASVAISDDFAVIGDDSYANVYIIPYDSANNRWNGGQVTGSGSVVPNVTRIVNPLGDVDNLFGDSVGLSGTTLVVGAPWAWNDGDAEYIHGRVWVYAFDGSSWDADSATATIDPIIELTHPELLNPETGEFYLTEDAFGDAVAISADKNIIVGAPGHHGGIGDDGLEGGSAYVFPYTGDGNNDSWAAGIPLAILDKASHDKFGSSVAISGNYAMAGSPDNDANSGAVYLFTSNDGGNSWARGIKFPFPEPQEDAEQFGTTVAVNAVSPATDGYRAVAGALKGWAQDGRRIRGSTHFWEGPHSQSPTARYPITYSGNGNDGGTVPVDPNIYAQGDQIIVDDNAGTLTLSGYRFEGWTRDGDTTIVYSPGDSFTMGTAGTTLVAEWVEIHSVTYDANLPAGTSLSTGSVPTDDMLYDPNDSVTVADSNGMTISGYRFTGWNSQADGAGTTYSGDFTITADTTLYAQWSELFSVSYDDNNSDGGTVPTDSNTYIAGDSVTVSANNGNLIRNGFSFGGWNTAASGSGTQYDATGSATFNMPAANVTLYARWLQHYAIAYSDSSSESGDIPANGSFVENDASFTLDSTAPTRDGYVFAGWYTDASLSGTRYMPGDVYSISTNADVTFHANWIPAGALAVTAAAIGASHTVIFDENAGGTGIDEYQRQTIAVGDNAVEPATPPFRPDYNFAGWYSDQALTQAYNFDTAVNNDITLYARWISQTVNHTARFFTNGGSVVPDQTVADGGSPVEPTAPTLSGFEFAGWYHKLLIDAYDFNAPLTADKDIFAKWVGVPVYTVNFEDNDGDTASNQIRNQRVVAGAAAVEPAAPPIKYRADFAGWYSDATLTTAYDFSSTVNSDITLYARWIDRWTTGDLASATDNVEWYYFDATAGSEYEITWDDSADGSSAYSGDVNVTAYQGDLVNTHFTAVDNGYGNNAQRITALADERMYIKVAVNSGAAGSYAVRIRKQYEIGDTGPAGGFIFYIDDGSFGVDGNGNVVWTYLEAAPARYDSPQQWGPYSPTAVVPRGIAIPGSNRTALGTGYDNTFDFIMSQMAGPQQVDGLGTDPIYWAAQYAASLSITHAANGGLFNDWFLPASDTMTQIYNNLYAADYDNDGIADNIGELHVTPGISFYWASTEDVDITCDSLCGAGQTVYVNRAWSLDVYGNGFVGVGRQKNANYYVRAVRRF